MVVIKESEVPIALETAGVVAREKEVGPYNVGFEHYSKADFTPLFRGLPNSQCQAEHHGFVLKGRLRYRYSTEKWDDIGPGQAYYIPPGHTFEVLEDGTEIVEFSPKTKAFEQTMAAFEKNMASLKPGKPR